jgi:4-amino-4-deoxy-L-arabinose transferase-like glycosyltransferase
MNRRLLGLTFLFVTAFALRLALVVLLRDIHVGPTGISSADDVEFDVLAKNLASGEGYRNVNGRLTSFRAPGWPLFLAGIYVVAGEQPALVYIVNCLLGALSCLLAYALGRELLSPRAAWLAGWLTALFLPHAWFATLFYSENLFVPLLGASAWLLIRQQSGGSMWLVLLGGLLVGCAVLTRPFALLLLPLWGLALLASGTTIWNRLLAPVLLGLGALVIVAPWTWRNHVVHGHPVLVATNGGSTFYGSNNDRVVREWRLWGAWVSTVDLPGRDEIMAAPDEVSHDQVEWQLGMDWVKAHPHKAMLIAPLKVARLIFWVPDFDGGPRWYYAVRGLCYLPYLVLLLVGAWSCFTGASGRPGWAVIHLTMLATVITAIIFWGTPRFRDANAPLLMLYPALALTTRRASLRSDLEDPTGTTSMPSVMPGSMITDWEKAR